MSSEFTFFSLPISVCSFIQGKSSYLICVFPHHSLCLSFSHCSSTLLLSACPLGDSEVNAKEITQKKP